MDILLLMLIEFFGISLMGACLQSKIRILKNSQNMFFGCIGGLVTYFLKLPVVFIIAVWILCIIISHIVFSKFISKNIFDIKSEKILRLIISFSVIVMICGFFISMLMQVGMNNIFYNPILYIFLILFAVSVIGGIKRLSSLIDMVTKYNPDGSQEEDTFKIFEQNLKEGSDKTADTLIAEKSEYNSVYDNYHAEKLEYNSIYDNYHAENTENNDVYSNYYTESSEDNSAYGNYYTENPENNSAYGNYYAEDLKNNSVYSDYYAEKQNSNSSIFEEKKKKKKKNITEIIMPVSFVMLGIIIIIIGIYNQYKNTMFFKHAERVVAIVTNTEKIDNHDSKSGYSYYCDVKYEIDGTIYEGTLRISSDGYYRIKNITESGLVADMLIYYNLYDYNDIRLGMENNYVMIIIGILWTIISILLFHFINKNEKGKHNIHTLNNKRIQYYKIK